MPAKAAETAPSLSFLKPMENLLCALIVLCHGNDDEGEPFWAYMCIKPGMAQAFREARERGGFNLEDYGVILEMGEGTEVPPDISQRMEREYGINHDYEDDIFKTTKGSDA